MSAKKRNFQRIFDATPYEISYFIGERPLGAVSEEHPTKDNHYLFLSYKDGLFKVAERVVESRKEEGLDKEWGELIWGEVADKCEEMKKEVKLYYNRGVIVA